MGSPVTENFHAADETQHRVVLTRGFWMMETEVTQELWAKLVPEGLPNTVFNRRNIGPRMPAIGLEEEHARMFCDKLARELSEEVSLPTEAQWEYACRAGFEGAVHPNSLADDGWHATNSDKKTQPVAGLKPNAWGLYDMLGNVGEWCADAPRQRLGEDDVTDPFNEPTAADSMRTFRGSHFYSPDSSCRYALRTFRGSGERLMFVGFRMCVKR